MIYTDGDCLVSDSSQEELHRFASRLGLRRDSYQRGNPSYYDLTMTRKLRTALEKGAIRVSSEEIADLLRDADF